MAERTAILRVGGLGTVTLSLCDCSAVVPVFISASHRILKVKAMPTMTQTRPKGLVGMFAGSRKETRQG